MHYSNDPDKFPHTHNITVPRWKHRFSSITEVKERRAWLVAYLDGWHHLPCNTLMSLINAPQIHANSMYYSKDSNKRPLALTPCIYKLYSNGPNKCPHNHSIIKHCSKDPNKLPHILTPLLCTTLTALINASPPPLTPSLWIITFIHPRHFTIL